MAPRKTPIAAPVAVVLLAAVISSGPSTSDAFTVNTVPRAIIREAQHSQIKLSSSLDDNDVPLLQHATKFLTSVAATAALSASLFLNAGAAFAENELGDKYSGKGFQTDLVDQTCLVDKCSLQAKACLADDPSCRKGLTCTAKCLGDSSCITGCMARYSDQNLDNLLKCSIVDNECIKIAILDGKADKLGEEPPSPIPTVRNFDMASMQGSWYKVVGFNPNYDCFACQRNTFSAPEGGNALGIGNDRLQMDVEFSMPHLMPDGTPPPPENKKESVKISDVDGLMYGSQSIAFNDYRTHETMVFDNARDSSSKLSNLVLGKGTDKEQSYSRTAHTEGEMFGLGFWENWYIVGENDPGQAEFKFVYYNGKTLQNTYEGAFVYSRSRELTPDAMQKVYQIASDAGLNPDQFCKIRNGCFRDESTANDIGTPSNPFRGIIASTKISQLLGVESVAAETVVRETPPPKVLMPAESATKRAWWYEVGDYLEDPNRHYRAMDSLRENFDWPDFVKNPTGLSDN